MLRKLREQKQEQYYSTRVCIAQRKAAKSIKISSREALKILKKRIHLLEAEYRSTKEAMEEEKANNYELITNLRKEIQELRLAGLHPGANECLMRQALTAYHTGSSIFLEKEPRDVIDSVYDSLACLTNKLNTLRHQVRMKNRRLNTLLIAFNDTVEDVVYLELEGPMGDARCLDAENLISDVGSKFLHAETLQHTYKHIIDQLTLERLTNETSIEALKQMQRNEDARLAASVESMKRSKDRKTAALATAHKTEYDNHAARKHRNRQLADFKRQAEEQRHELGQVRRDIQAFFAFQESVPLGRSLSAALPMDSVGMLGAEGELHDLRAETHVLQTVTGSHSVPELVECFERQQVTCIHLQSMVKEATVRKSVLLGQLEGLAVRRDASVYHTPPPEEEQLTGAGDRLQQLRRRGAQGRWSAVAAAARATQALARVRQMLECLAAVVAHAGLMETPPPKLSSETTEEYLTGMMALVSDGVSQLMAGLEEPDEALRRAHAAQFGLTRSEERVACSPVPALATGVGNIPSTDEGETTDDVELAVRIAMKQQARFLVNAKLKAGFGKKKTY